MAVKTFYRGYNVIRVNGTPRRMPGMFSLTIDAIGTHVLSTNESYIPSAKVNKILVEECQGHEYTFKKKFVAEPADPPEPEEWEAEEVDTVPTEAIEAPPIPEPIPEPTPVPPTVSSMFTMYRLAFKERGPWGRLEDTGPLLPTLQAVLDSITAFNILEGDTGHPIVWAVIEVCQVFDVTM